MHQSSDASSCFSSPSSPCSLRPGPPLPMPESQVVPVYRLDCGPTNEKGYFCCGECTWLGLYSRNACRYHVRRCHPGYKAKLVRLISTKLTEATKKEKRSARDRERYLRRKVGGDCDRCCRWQSRPSHLLCSCNTGGPYTGYDAGYHWQRRATPEREGQCSACGSTSMSC